jgi:hypothetical protein
MNLTSWLNELAAAYPRHEMTKVQLFEYRQELETWPLSLDEWRELKVLAKQRHVMFPSIAELGDIMREVKSRNRPVRNPAFRIWKDNEGRCWAQPLPGEAYNDSEICSVEEGKKVFARAFLEAGGKPELLAKMQGLFAAQDAVKEKTAENLETYLANR